MLRPLQVAEYFMILIEEDVGESITNLKLQKLIYYAQGFHLALYGKPLFQDDIEAWAHGPVVPNLYHHYKQYGSSPIPKPQKIAFEIYSPKVKELLDEVYVIYGQYSAWKLRDLTHEEPTWKNYYNLPNKVIPHFEMETFFKTLIK